MSEARVVELAIPGSLAFRDLALRVVMEACKLLGARQSVHDEHQSETANGNRQNVLLEAGYELSDGFTAEFVSAFSEIYNNIPIHAYAGTGGGRIDLRIVIAEDHITVELTDTGKSFDIQAVPLPDSLPTGGMGIHIARSMVDELVYEPGPPNHWRLTKYVPSARKPSMPSVEGPPAAR